jgi:DNA-binding transcriptional LysR family regulator
LQPEETVFTLHNLETFIIVAEELHFGHAAQRLRISQPSLSQQIRRLEDDIKIKLFHRTKRRVELTDAGRVLLKESRALLSHVDRALNAVRRAGRGEIGQLILGVISSIDPRMLTRLLQLLNKRLPSVEILLHTLSTSSQIQALREHRIDVGLLRRPVRDDALTIELISSEPFVVALPANHPLARKPSIPLKMLASQRHILFPRHVAPGYYDLIVSLFHQADLPLEVAHESEHLQTILGLVGGGFGIFLMPRSMQNFRLRGVSYRPILGRIPQVETAVAFRREDKSEVLQAFLGVLRAIQDQEP